MLHVQSLLSHTVTTNAALLAIQKEKISSVGSQVSVGCPTMPNNRLDPTSVLLVQDHVHLRSILR
jgi:hypothetical protein